MENGQIDSWSREYVAPTLVGLGSLRELTLGCDKVLGASDTFTFQGQDIVCSSA